MCQFRWLVTKSSPPLYSPFFSSYLISHKTIIRESVMSRPKQKHFGYLTWLLEESSSSNSPAPQVREQYFVSFHASIRHLYIITFWTSLTILSPTMWQRSSLKKKEWRACHRRLVQFMQLWIHPTISHPSVVLPLANCIWIKKETNEISILWDEHNMLRMFFSIHPASLIFLRCEDGLSFLFR